MTTQLYLVPLPEAQTTRPPSEATSANVSAQGLIQQAGLATEKIALGSSDIQVNGQYRAGEFSKLLARELRSLGNSDYEAVAFADDTNPDADDQAAYVEVESVDVNRAHQSSALAYEYTVGLAINGTREEHWRAVPTTSEAISTGLATGSGGLVGIPAQATNPRWYDPTGANGTEAASATSTVNAEFGDVELYDPTAASFSDPTLIYGLSYDREGPVDVRVWDDVGGDKFVTYGGGDTVGSATVGTATVGSSSTIRQWVHAYHPQFEFEGAPIVDNGLIRVEFGDSIIQAYEWDESGGAWEQISISHVDYTLYNWDVEVIGPATVDVFAEFEDSGDGSIHAAVLSFQRGIDRAIVRQPDNGTIPGDLETMLQPLASDQTTDKRPSQGVVPSSEVK